TALGAGAWWVGVGRFTSVPGVLQLTEAAATKSLDQAGLGVEVGRGAYSETVPEGRVLATDPKAGDRILNGGTVTLTLSLGKERYDVPKVRGLTEDAAQDAIAAAKLVAGTSREAYDEKVPEGKVVGSDPPAGIRVKPGTAVILTVSRGPKPIDIRDWTGRSADRAIAVLEQLGLVVDASEDWSTEVPIGRVISQSPSSGQLFRGDQVTLVVSKGPELVTIPSGLRATGVRYATRALEALGLVVKTRESDAYLGLGFVSSVDPGEGEQVPIGSTVYLYLV
ncbi:MAG: PASTA domain-containing protein, partial [Nocardioides sp.]